MWIPKPEKIIKVEVFVACMPYSDYTYVICVPSQKTEDFLYAGRCTSYTDSGNLKSAVISNDRHEPKLRQGS